MQSISLSAQTMFADLLQWSLDAEFDNEFGSSGYFKKAKRGGKYYWYFRTGGATRSERYVGPVTDKPITDRINRFRELKSDYHDRKRIVRALVGPVYRVVRSGCTVDTSALMSGTL